MKDLNVLADLALVFGAEPITSARAAALLDRHVQAVGNGLAAVARAGTAITGPTGAVRLVRVREVQGGRSLWRFERHEDPGADLL